MTDNRTNEELATRLRQLAESQAMDFDSPNIARTLNEVADRLSGTVTEAMIEAAAKALYANKTGSERGFEHTLFRRTWLQSARIALVAAQEAAPQAESDERIQAWERLVQHPVWRSCFEEERPLINSMMERIDDLAELEMTVNELAPAPVLPSSGVDEDALAEVILAAEYAHRYAEFRGDRDIGTLAHYQARAVAEFLTAPQKETVKWEYREKISTYPDGSLCVGMQIAEDHVKDFGFEGRKIVRRRVGEWEEIPDE